MMAASYNRLQKSVSQVRFIMLILASLLLLHTQFTASASMQESQPFTKKRLVDSLTAGQSKNKRISQTKYLQLIRQHGVDFRVKPADEQAIRKAGNYLNTTQLDQLIAAVRANYRPETTLSGTIEKVEVIEKSDGGSEIFVRLLVRNVGDPTIAQKYYLQITHVTSKSIDFKSSPNNFSEPVTLPQMGGAQRIIIQPQDMLTFMTGKALGRNEEVRGWLNFVFPFHIKSEFLRQPGIQYFISFADVNGKPYETSYEVR